MENDMENQQGVVTATEIAGEKLKVVLACVRQVLIETLGDNFERRTEDDEGLVMSLCCATTDEYTKFVDRVMLLIQAEGINMARINSREMACLWRDVYRQKVAELSAS